MSAYYELTDEQKLDEAIKFVAYGHPLPEPLRAFLVEQGLHDAIVNPGVSYVSNSNTIDHAHQSGAA